MRYNIKKNLHNDFKVFEKNKLAPRAYAVPYGCADTLKGLSYAEERYGSDMVELLNGAWDFKLYDSIASLPDTLDSLKVRFSKMAVPGDWQRAGFLPPVYLNCPYEFKEKEPGIPEDMPVGVYRTVIDIADPDKIYILSFLGASNNLSVYLNGKFVGYSEGSHNTAEFDITSLLAPGANELLVVSFKWCNGTLLECQDMFRENGIFRDVLLYRYDKTYLWDYEVRTQNTEKGYAMAVDVMIEGETEGFTVTARLLDKTGGVVCEATAPADAKTAFCFEDLPVIEWNPEIPTVYDLYITLSGEGVSETVRNVTGFKTVTIEGSVFRFNGMPIKMKGVNHHDSTLLGGYVMTFAEMEKDIALMKRLNVNAVRTSHYPPDPFFLTLCDVYGLYVVDEADIETHGAEDAYGDFHYISKQAKWASHYVDRVRRMYYRDRNHPCVTMWSLGNESGGYKCQDACYKFLKETGTPIPVHYESVIHSKRMHYDVVSEMYTSTEAIEEMMRHKRKWSYGGGKPKLCRDYNEFPFFLCEYCHAMGVGPGNMEEYWDLIYEWDTAMGGCVWEWADHTVYHPQPDKKYKYQFTYGGDHGEKRHDGHFCVDGLLYADRSLHTGAREMRIVYRPLRASVAGEKLYCFENTNRFRRSDYIGVKWTLTENGVDVDEGELTVDLAPMQAECFPIAHKDICLDKDCHLNLIYTDKETGVTIAEEQLTLNDAPYEYDIEIGQRIAAATENGVLTVSFENGEAVFDCKTGVLTAYKVNGKDLLAGSKGFLPNLSRAFIDNDARNLERWKPLGELKCALKDMNVTLDDGEVKVDVIHTLKSGRKPLYDVRLTYVLSSLGAMEVTASLEVTAVEAEVDIPRFGLMIEWNRDFENAAYYGRGEAENMPDFKAQSPIGIYSARVSDMREKYVYPQESGMHCDTKWLKLSDAEGNELAFYADDVFNFSLRHFTQELLNKAAHEEDLHDMNMTLLTIDGVTRGIGSSSCGPDTREEYRLNALKGYSFSFTVIPKIK